MLVVEMLCVRRYGYIPDISNQVPTSGSMFYFSVRSLFVLSVPEAFHFVLDTGCGICSV